MSETIQPEILEKIEMVKRKARSPKPTVKQIKALRYMNQGMSQLAAMKKAGYSKNSASKPSQEFWPTKGVQALISSMALELADSGLNTAFMVKKFKEWMDAKKYVGKNGEEVNDPATQMLAYDRWKKVMDEQAPQKTDGGKIKRKMTIEEFITGEDSKDE